MCLAPLDFGAMAESSKLTPKKRASLEWRREFAKRYEQARTDADVTYEAIGRHLGVSKSLSHHWANALSEITAPQVVQLADFLGVDAGWLLSGRGYMRAQTYLLPMQKFEAGKRIIADLVSVEVASNSVNGLSIGDEAIFARNRPPEPGDIVLAIIEGKLPFIGRYLRPSASNFQLVTDDGKEPRIVGLSEVTWKGVLTRRTKYGSR